MKKVFAVTAALALLGLSIAAQSAITIDTVTVGDAGNTADTTGYGSVGYNYNIGKYEVTAGQYTAFLNAKANVSDTYGLYNGSMWSDSYGCKIERTSISGGYSYSVASDYANRPVNYVSYWDSLRFANWLGNGQGTGSTETGAYTLTPTGITNNTITRNTGWKWAVTSEDEWYKAAYYEGDSTSAGYWDYPTSSNTAPGRDMADASGNNANIFGTPYPIDSGHYTTVVGEFENSRSAYGTFDQGGNLWEWNEAVVYPDSLFASRGVRGGLFSGYDSLLRASSRNYYMTDGYHGVGFRLVQAVPEPSSIIALLGGLAGLLGTRRRRA